MRSNLLYSLLLKNQCVGALALMLFCVNQALPQTPVPVPEPAQTTTLDAPAPFPQDNELFVPIQQPTSDIQPVSKSETRLVTPMRYFVPSKSKPLQTAGTQELRQKYTDIAAERAAIMSLEELRVEIADAEKTLKEFAANEALKKAEQALKEVVTQYPNSDAGLRAQNALYKLAETTAIRRPLSLKSKLK